MFSAPVSEGEPERYKVTAAVAEKLLNSDIFNGLLYPSVAARARSDNIAIKPSFTTALEFVRAEYANIEVIEGDGWRATVVDTAGKLGDDGQILWRGRPEQWVLKGEGATLTLTAENGRWVARNAAGEIVDAD